MRTLGIDLAARPPKTAICEVDWRDGSAAVATLAAGKDRGSPLDDKHLLELARGADKVAIDAPFGWPDEFIAAVSAHARRERWSGHEAGDPDDFRALLSYRETDRFVKHNAGQPLSVSTDKLGITAMRCAHLLDLLAAEGAAVDRSGERGLVVEVYPAGALLVWGLKARGYKGAKGRELLATVFHDFAQRLSKLQINAEQRQICSQSDDAFDALVCAVLARAAALGETVGVPPAHRTRADREGWIHLPKAGSLARLVQP